MLGDVSNIFIVNDDQKKQELFLLRNDCIDI